MGRFKRSRAKRARKAEKLECFDRGEYFIVCKLTPQGWEQIDDMTFPTCEACTKAIGTTECYI